MARRQPSLTEKKIAEIQRMEAKLFDLIERFHVELRKDFKYILYKEISVLQRQYSSVHI